MSFIFMHGLGQTAASWKQVMDFFHHEIQISCPELLSMVGGEEVTYGNLYKGFVKHCNEFDTRLYLCGISLGAVLALNYAIEYPEKVESLVLIAPQYKMPRFLLQLQNIVFSLMPESSFQGMGVGKKDIIRLTKSMWDLDFSSNIRNISCPALIIYGEKDKANKKAAKELADMLGKGELCEIKNTGHEVNRDAPKALGKEIKRFWMMTNKK